MRFNAMVKVAKKTVSVKKTAKKIKNLDLDVSDFFLKRNIIIT